MKKIDLHIHTHYSDGIFSPIEILEMANKNNYDVIAITDHDTLEGYNFARQFIKKFNMKLIPGVEISSYYKDKDVHILAYNFNPTSSSLISLLKKIQESRLKRAEKIVEKLRNLGIHIQMEKVLAMAGKSNLIGRPHIARVLVKNGDCNTNQEAFDYFLGNDSPAYVKKNTPSIEEICETVNKAEGVTVLAHPHTLFNDNYVREILMKGVGGIEAFYSTYNKETIKRYSKIAEEFGIIRTGGSDFHGDLNDFDIFGEYTAPEIVLDYLNGVKHE